MINSTKYWDERAAAVYTYKGEKFYTITAIPYYFLRRRIILDMINSQIEDGNHVCDFGCGDGEYIRLLSSRKKNCTFHGVDISEQMIRDARQRNVSDMYTWEISGDGIHKPEFFDVVYSSAIFAHLSDENVDSLFSNIHSHIRDCSGGADASFCVSRRHPIGM